MNLLKIIIFISLLFLISCDEGVEPEEKQVGFIGTITFQGEWPDSIKQSRIVLFQDPLLAVGDFNAVNLKFASGPIPLGVSTYSYNTTAMAEYGEVIAGEYAYLAVAQSTSEELSLSRSAWVVAGVYYVGGNTSTPGTLVVPANTVLEGIDIACDFDNPPPQPPSE